MSAAAIKLRDLAGEVQLVYMGLPYVEWGDGSGDEWGRQASATQTYMKANRPQPASEVPLHFLRGTDLLHIDPSACDNCFFLSTRLVDSQQLLRQLLDFWHSDCARSA